MQKFIKVWLSCWLYVIMAIAGALIGLAIWNWYVWTLQTKLVAFSTAMLAIHVLEEWRFPGGFHYMYNIMAKSELPDRYPMNQLSDMLTNWIGIVFGCVVMIVGVTPITAFMQFMLSLGEVLCHTASGFYIKKLLKEKDKRTIYNPGLATSICGFLPISIGFIYSFIERTPTFTQIILAIVFGGILMAISLPGAERVFKSKETPYPYDWGHGYFERYVK